MGEIPGDLSKEAIKRITAVLSGDAKFEDVEARLAWLPRLRLLTKFGGNPNEFRDSIKYIKRLQRSLVDANVMLTKIDSATLHVLNVVLEDRVGLSASKLEDAVYDAATARDPRSTN